MCWAELLDNALRDPKNEPTAAIDLVPAGRNGAGLADLIDPRLAVKQ
jgi:hypothetical protein